MGDRRTGQEMETTKGSSNGATRRKPSKRRVSGSRVVRFRPFRYYLAESCKPGKEITLVVYSWWKGDLSWRINGTVQINELWQHAGGIWIKNEETEYYYYLPARYFVYGKVMEEYVGYIKPSYPVRERRVS